MMKKKFLFWLIIYLLIAKSSSYAQERREIHSFELYASYGLFSFINVDDLSAYLKGKDSKLLSSGFRLNLNSGYSMGLRGAYQKLYLNTKDTQNVFYVEREYYTSRLDKTLLNNQVFELYVSVLSGIKKEKRHLILGDKITYEPTWEFVPLGVLLKIGNHLQFYGESAYSRAAVLGLGVVCRFLY